MLWDEVEFYTNIGTNMSKPTCEYSRLAACKFSFSGGYQAKSLNLNGPEQRGSFK